MSYLLWTPRDRGVRLWAGSRVLAPAAIATLPTWMRRMGNFDQPAAVDAAVTPVAQAMVRALSARNSRPMVAMARRLAPQTAEILAQHLAAGPPASPQTITSGTGARTAGCARLTQAGGWLGVVGVAAREAAARREHREHDVVEFLRVACRLVDRRAPHVSVR